MTMDRLAAMEALSASSMPAHSPVRPSNCASASPLFPTRWASLRPPDAVSFKPTERNHRRSNATSLETVQNPR
jgi:hypothetical protein